MRQQNQHCLIWFSKVSKVSRRPVSREAERGRKAGRPVSSLAGSLLVGIAINHPLINSVSAMQAARGC